MTASLDVIEEAVHLGADALLVHHGYFWKNETPLLRGMKLRRIKTLLQHDINLFAYHLPLDCHPTIGNNAQLAVLLDLKEVHQHEAQSVEGLVWSGQLPEAMAYDTFFSKLQKHFTNVQPVRAAPNIIRSIAWCSGAGQDLIDYAHRLKVDAYLSGEISERTYYSAIELGLHYFGCGHHATERLGIRALGEHIAEKFGLTHHFLDSLNPY